MMPKILQNIVRVFPMTQGIELIKWALLGLPSGAVWLQIVSAAVVTAVCGIVTVKRFRWE